MSGFRDSVQSGFRDPMRFSFPSSSWSASSASPADSGDGSSDSFPRRNDGCSYTRVVKSRCFLDHTGDDARPIKKCERTEQLLRSCVGKPQEIVESKSESTEEEVPNGWTMEVNEEEGMVPFSHDSFPQPPQFSSKPFQGRDPLSKGISDGLESFMQAAEEMMNDVFNQFGIYKQEGSSKSHPAQPWKAFPESRMKGKDESMPAEKAPPKRSDFGDSAGFDEV